MGGGWRNVEKSNLKNPKYSPFKIPSQVHGSGAKAP
jgi:hypothetical protein